MTAGREPFLIPGRRILTEVRDAYSAAYRQANQDDERGVVIVRFRASPEAGSDWAGRMEASRISAEQKQATLTALGNETRVVTLADTAARSELAAVIDHANRDPRVTAMIVQSPPPARMVSLLNTIDPAKDIDALGLHTIWPRGATADGILRVADPFLDVDARVAVVGSRGFVGRGVMSGLQAAGHDPRPLDLGDDLRGIRDVDVVITAAGHPGLLTPEHLRPEHRLVVDSGFMITTTGPRGDVAPAAGRLPAAITPVPGGIGPVEMAVLAERVTHRHAAPDLASWRYHGPDSAEASLTTAADTVARHREARSRGERPESELEGPGIQHGPVAPEQQTGDPRERGSAGEPTRDVSSGASPQRAQEEDPGPRRSPGGREMHTGADRARGLGERAQRAQGDREEQENARHRRRAQHETGTERETEGWHRDDR